MKTNSLFDELFGQGWRPTWAQQQAMNAAAGEPGQGRHVTQEVDTRMNILRAGNILRDARDDGWGAQIQRIRRTSPLNFDPIETYRVVYRRPDGQLLYGPENGNRRAALLMSIDQVERGLK